MAELSEQKEQELGDIKSARQSSNGLWFGVIILLIIIGLAGAGFYFFSQLRDQQQDLGGEVKGEMSKQIADYQSQLVAIQSQLASLESNVAGKDNHFTQTLADFSQLHNEKLDGTRNELNDAIIRLQRQLGKTRGDWLIADAEYLLSVANERLHLVGDVNTTREALEAADQRLRESGDASTFKVREEIAKELSLLKSIAVPDVVGIYASIQTLQDRVDKLALLLPYTGKTLASPADSKKSPLPTENQGLLDSAISQLQDAVVIRHTEHEVKEILTPEEALFIREQLRVKLEMVKISLVQRNEVLFQSSLADVKKWTEQNFTKNTDDSFLADLERLNITRISSQLPDISLSLKMIKDIATLRVETDKAIQPLDAMVSVKKPTAVESSKPVETLVPAQAVEPSK
ncbi:MAG: enzyme of heme biosynthesis [Methylococcales bacterium]|nr:MAG: enzyme of heme biosynthesis [Methylococcales bacterium]